MVCYVHVCIGKKTYWEETYRGENQEQYIPADTVLAWQGRYPPPPPSVLKGFSLGILSTKKRGMVFFWGIKRYGRY